MVVLSKYFESCIYTVTTQVMRTIYRTETYIELVLFIYIVLLMLTESYGFCIVLC